ncbi:MAG: hypothetical protein AB1626_02385 [Candidatus Micrarchaeota archaeon]
MHLKPSGFFVNQCCSLSTKKERDVADRVYRSTQKIGRRHFQWKGDVAGIYLRAGFSAPEKVGEAPVLRLSEKDHVSRYALNKREVEEVRRLITRAGRMRNVRVTPSGYEMTFVFPIYAARLKR